MPAVSAGRAAGVCAAAARLSVGEGTQLLRVPAAASHHTPPLCTPLPPCRRVREGRGPAAALRPLPQRLPPRVLRLRRAGRRARVSTGPLAVLVLRRAKGLCKRTLKGAAVYQRSRTPACGRCLPAVGASRARGALGAAGARRCERRSLRAVAFLLVPLPPACPIQPPSLPGLFLQLRVKVGDEVKIAYNAKCEVRRPCYWDAFEATRRSLP